MGAQGPTDARKERSEEVKIEGKKKTEEVVLSEGNGLFVFRPFGSSFFAFAAFASHSHFLSLSFSFPLLFPRPLDPIRIQARKERKEKKNKGSPFFNFRHRKGVLQFFIFFC